MQKILLTTLLIILVILVGCKSEEKGESVYVGDSQESTSNSKTPDKPCEVLAYLGRGELPESFMAECMEIKGQDCDSPVDCGNFDCEEGKCVVKPCDSDADCPSMCGLHATPVPGFCTTIDVK